MLLSGMLTTILMIMDMKCRQYQPKKIEPATNASVQNIFKIRLLYNSRMKIFKNNTFVPATFASSLVYILQTCV